MKITKIEKLSTEIYLPITPKGDILAIDTYYGDVYSSQIFNIATAADQMINKALNTKEEARIYVDNMLTDITGSKEFNPEYEIKAFKLTIEEIE